MSDHYTCECGETVDPKGTPHQCPGTPNDRLDALERQIERLIEILAAKGLLSEADAAYIDG